MAKRPVFKIPPRKSGEKANTYSARVSRERKKWLKENPNGIAPKGNFGNIAGGYGNNNSGGGRRRGCWKCGSGDHETC